MNRLRLFFLVLFCSTTGLFGQNLEDKVEGLLIGSAIGDAAGAPLEFFYPAQRSQWSCSHDPLSAQGKMLLAKNFKLVPHFRKANSYGHWLDYGPAGTITDDTRFKIIFMNTLRNHQVLTSKNFAMEVLNFSSQFSDQMQSLCDSWLSEFGKAAKWELGLDEKEGALPPQRLWAGVQSMAGQMPLLPIAAVYHQDLEMAYKKAWELDFFDHGTARDINAALVTGLAAALAPDASWPSIEAAMRSVDPYGFGDALYGKRGLHTWLDFAHEAVQQANGSPGKLFDILEAELDAKVWWESWVPLVVVFATAEITNYHPLASMQLMLEFGHDTDSYAQLMGAFMGAIHGAGVFPDSMRNTVEASLQKDYDENIDSWVRNLLGTN